MFNQVSVHFNNYAQKLPRNIPQAASKSALYSFAVSTLLSGNIQRGIFSATLAATLSVVSSLTMPFFREGFADRLGNLKWYHQAVATVINLAVSDFLINSLTAYRVDLLRGVALTVSLTLLLNEFRDRSTYESQSYILV